MTATAMIAPLPDSPELERYQIYSRSELVALLREILHRRVLVTIYFSNGTRFIVTNLLAINPDFEELVFDCGADEEVTRALTRSSRFTVVTFLDQVKIQFSGQRMELTSFEDAPALRMRVPDSLLRFQRREFYRTQTIGKPLMWRLPLAAPDGKTAEGRIVDISCGGIALLVQNEHTRIEPGTVLRECEINLPEIGRLSLTLEIRSAAGGTGTGNHRYGCAFVGIPGPVVALIQRYVNNLQRARLSRS